MKTTLTTESAISELLDDIYKSWTYAGARALVEYIEEMEQDLGEEIELDPVALRCEFSEYPSLIEWAQEYFVDWTQDTGEDLSGPTEDESDDDFSERVDDAIRGYIQYHGQLIEFDGGIIVSSF